MEGPGAERHEAVTALAGERCHPLRTAVAAGSSVDQESAARAYREKDGLTPAAALRDHVSGRTPLDERSGGRTLLALISGGAVQHVITFDASQLSRDEAGVNSLVRKWNDAGITIHIVTHGGPVAPDDIMREAADIS